MSATGEAWLGLSLAARLPGFLRRPWRVDEARAAVQGRLASRAASFLDLMRHAVHGRPASPYRALLRHAGCEAGDVERLARQDGLEGALRTLARAGVYLTVEEFKGRAPIVRGGRPLAADHAGLLNPRAGVHVVARTSGSRGAPTRVPADLPFIRDRAATTLVALAARGGLDWEHATWHPPGSGALVPILRMTVGGARPSRWFAMVAAGTEGLHPRYRWSQRALSGVWVAAGLGWLRAETVGLEDPATIARWMAATRRAGRTPHLYTLVSPAVRLCQAARQAGVDISGAELTVTGEPLTPARLAAIHAAGVEARPTYASIETGGIGEGCLARDASDDVHVLTDRLAVVQPGPDVGSLPTGALLLSSLRPVGPFVFLNVSLGDEAEMIERACGCPLEAVGWTTHLRAIRSQEKLTAWGMSLLDADVVRVLEEVLPARFGGGPTHYQLVEDAAPDGASRLRLLVHPAVGPLDASAVGAAFLDAVAAGSGADRVASLVWRQAGALTVERSAPIATASGKIHHVHAPAGPRPDG